MTDCGHLDLWELILTFDLRCLGVEFRALGVIRPLGVDLMPSGLTFSIWSPLGVNSRPLKVDAGPWELILGPA